MHLNWNPPIPLITTTLLLLLPSVSPYTPLSNDQSTLLKSSLPLPLQHYLSPQNGTLLSPILIPRASGSDNVTRVLNYFKDFFTHNLTNWSISTDEFVEHTPRGNVKFVNFVATRDPPGVRTGDVGRLVVTAHYDSKWFAKGSGMEGFIGATDSAVPCAFLMYAALALDKYLVEWEAKIRAESDDDLEDPMGLQVPSHSMLGVDVDYFL